MRRRRNRYFRPLKRKPRFPNFYVVDVETGYRKGKKVRFDLIARPENFILGAVVGPDVERAFDNLDALKSFLMTKRFRRKLVFAHNGEFDFTCMYGNLYALDPDAVFNGSKFIVATNGVCKFGDSMNILPTSVAQLGKMLGTPKGKPDFDNATLEEIESYCINDCHIVYNALFKAFSMATPQLTIGSLCLELFRRYFMERSYHVDRLTDNFFKAYYGGRNEAFKLGRVAADVYDINSAYPYYMLNSKFPDPENLRIKKNPPVNDFVKVLKTHEGMVTAVVDIADVPIPPLPVRGDGKLLFPVGRIVGSWCFNEFRAALPYLKIIEVQEIIFSKPIASPFKDFINHYYTLRSTTVNDFSKYYYKLLMNNLYGKLAQRNQTRSRMLLPGESEKKIMKRYGSKSAEMIDTEYGRFLVMKVDGYPKSFTVACWAAYITAGVRIMLFEAMDKRTIYCDTDSQFLPLGSKFHGKLSGALGGWKRELKTVVRINTLKDYDYIERYSSKRALKGVKKNSLEISRYEFEYLRMIKTKESFRRIDGQPAGTFIKQRKHLTGAYTKRHVNKDGTTKPIFYES